VRSHGIHASLVLAVLAALSAAPLATAEEAHVYESLSDVAIGRIFLSPRQRAELDKRRGKKESHSSREQSVRRAPRKTFPEAAGYIVSSTGKARVWARGDFVATDEVSKVTFPGDVEISRKSQDKQDANPDSGARDDGA